jgi:UDP-2,4-diacetamido-2,4,6-trideoxy-beta-L-altropyranose hydrolase
MTLVIRADASAAIGTGHVMRCLALAQAAVAAGHAVRLLSASLPTALRAQFVRERVALDAVDAAAGSPADVASVVGVANGTSADWVVVDGYHFDTDYIAAVRAGGHRVLQFDDEAHAAVFAADLVLNQNSYATAALYAGRVPNGEALTGCAYTLIRREFLGQGLRGDQAGRPLTHVLVSFGGSDPTNITPRVVRALVGRPFRVTAVVGPANPFHDAVCDAAAAVGARASVRRSVENMAPLLASADVAVLSGGSTCWEAACLGVPMLLTMTAEHQRGVIQALVNAGAARSLGDPDRGFADRLLSAVDALAVDGAARAEMARHGCRMIDGQGSTRVLQALECRPARKEARQQPRQEHAR